MSQVLPGVICGLPDHQKRNNGLGIHHPHSFFLPHPSCSIAFRIKPGPDPTASCDKGRKSIAAPKFMCLMHTEAKETKTWKFGAEKGLLQGPSKEDRWLMFKRPELTYGFLQSIFKGNIWGNGCRVYDFLLIGQW